MTALVAVGILFLAPVLSSPMHQFKEVERIEDENGASSSGLQEAQHGLALPTAHPGYLSSLLTSSYLQGSGSTSTSVSPDSNKQSLNLQSNAYLPRRNVPQKGYNVLDPEELRQPNLTPEQLEMAFDALKENPDGTLTTSQRWASRQRLRQKGFPLLKNPKGRPSKTYLLGLPIPRTIYRTNENKEDKSKGQETGFSVFSMDELPEDLTPEQRQLAMKVMEDFPTGSLTRRQKTYQRMKLRKAGIQLIMKYTRREPQNVKQAKKSERKIHLHNKSSQNKSTSIGSLTDIQTTPSDFDSVNDLAEYLFREDLKDLTSEEVETLASMNRPDHFTLQNLLRPTGPPPPGVAKANYLRTYISPEERDKLDPNQRQALNEFYSKYPLDKPVTTLSSAERRTFYNMHHALRLLQVPLPFLKRGRSRLNSEEIEMNRLKKKQYDMDRRARIKEEKKVAAEKASSSKKISFSPFFTSSPSLQFNKQ